MKSSGGNGSGDGKKPDKLRETPGIADLPGSEDAVADCRVERANALRAAVSGGTYRVESKKVAGKIVEDAVREIRNRTR